jgi:hypothetical protein
VRLRSQAGLPVAEIAAAELVVAGVRDAGVPTGTGDGDLAASNAVEDSLAQMCEAVSWGHGVLPPIDFDLDGVRMLVASLFRRKELGMSTSNVGTTA